ncbi:MAG: hypothetical protein AAF738_09975, partial [Bacteroidota bacterium]
MKTYSQHIIILLAVLTWFSQQSNAQSIRGKVTDERNTPISDAYIYANSGENHCHSNALGGFELLNT